MAEDHFGERTWMGADPQAALAAGYISFPGGFILTTPRCTALLLASCVVKAPLVAPGMTVRLIACEIRAPITAQTIEICECDGWTVNALHGALVLRGLVCADVLAKVGSRPTRIVGMVITPALYRTLGPNIQARIGDVPDEEVREFGEEYALHSQL